MNNHAPSERLEAFKRLLWDAPRQRTVAPSDQPFAYRTHRGCRREHNQDTALVLAGRRRGSAESFIAGILTDGMGGLEHGDHASMLATAWIAYELAAEGEATPEARLGSSLRAANDAVYRRFRGRAGAAVTTFLVEADHRLVGWVGDARAYGISTDRGPLQVTRDDTVAAIVASVEGGGHATDPPDSLTAALGVGPDLKPHVEALPAGIDAVVLMSDGVHRIDRGAFAWVCRHARSPEHLVSRLVDASLWEGGADNATAVALDLRDDPTRSLRFPVTGQVLALWAVEQPVIWCPMDHVSAFGTSGFRRSQGPGRNDQRGPRTPTVDGSPQEGALDHAMPDRCEDPGASRRVPLAVEVIGQEDDRS